MAGTLTPPIAYAPEDAAAATGVSRTRIFEAIRDGELTARKAGRATIIEFDDLAAWVRSLPVKGKAK
jgi:excisionase family DNA binding protein